MGTLVFQATAGGSFNFVGPNIAGTVSLTLPSADGTSGQFLKTDGAGTLSFAAASTTPGGSTTQVQYNNAGAFAGITGATTNGTTLTLVAPVLGAATGTSFQGIVGNVTPAAGAFTTLSSSAGATFVGDNNQVNVKTAGTYCSIYFNYNTTQKAAIYSKVDTGDFHLRNDGAGSTYLYTGGAIIATIASTGLAVTGTLSATGLLDLSGAAAGQIQFPATQNASANANTLDDYEEGTFTPTITGGTTSGTGTYNLQVGTYTKIGRQVNVNIWVAWTAHTGSGFLSIASLPFTSSNTTANGYNTGSFGYLNNLALSALNVATAHNPNNTARIDVYQYPSGGGSTTSVPLDTDASIMVSLTYPV